MEPIKDLIKHINKVFALDLNRIEANKIRRSILIRLGNPKTKKCTFCSEEKDISEFGLVGKSYKTPSINSRCNKCVKTIYFATLIKRQNPEYSIKQILSSKELLELKESELLLYNLKKIIKNGKK